MLTAAFLLSACAPATGDACRPGFARAGDGHCYPPAPDPDPPSITDAIEAMPCESLEPDGLVDLVGGCAESACARDTFAEFEATLDGDASCATASWNPTWVYCSWSQGLEALFPDEDQDLLADPEGRTDWIHLQSGYPHATEDGLGVDVSPRCWVDVLGVPTAATWIDSADGLRLRDLYWDEYGIEIHDSDGPDGLVDDVYLFGPQ